MSHFDFDDSEAEDLRYEARAQRQHDCRLLNHPDCQDPDHPGCDACNEESEE